MPLIKAAIVCIKTKQCKDMAEMKIVKTSEKILIWMHRTGITGQKIASEIGITRQAWSQKLRDNIFTAKDITTIQRLGYNE